MGFCCWRHWELDDLSLTNAWIAYQNPSKFSLDHILVASPISSSTAP